ncbi:hypothetical protein [Arcobacter arenosus]|jgi:hypothetical protein|uniref:hypothetical protein n=1 Tax=Arcobacter arenosus TaxID=2576037 RepID=UPI003BAC89B4
MKTIITFAICFIFYSNAYATEKFEEYIQTSKRFNTLLQKNIQENKLPRIDEKETREVLELFKTSQSKLLSLDYKVEDLGGLIQVCGKANKFGMTYVLDGMKSIIKEGGTKKETYEKIINLISTNHLKYQKELEVFYPFLIECLGMEASLVEGFWNSLPNEQKTQIRKNGIIQARNGLFQTYVGVLKSFAENKVDASFNESLLNSLINAANSTSSILPIKARENILNMLVEVKKNTNTKYHKSFDKIYKVFENKECNIICQI